MFFKIVEVEAEAISFQIGQLEAEAEAVQKSTASASLITVQYDFSQMKQKMTT